jgi:hypothetical protein
MLNEKRGHLPAAAGKVSPNDYRAATARERTNGKRRKIGDSYLGVLAE